MSILDQNSTSFARFCTVVATRASVHAAVGEGESERNRKQRVTDYFIENYHQSHEN